MSVFQLQQNVLALPETEQHQFFAWVHRQEAGYGDVEPEAVCQMVAEVWDDLDAAGPAHAHAQAR